MAIFRSYVNVYQRVTPPFIHHPPWSSLVARPTLAIRLTFALGLHGPRENVTTGDDGSGGAATNTQLDGHVYYCLKYL